MNMLETTETLLDNKKKTYEKNNCLMHTISLVIICLLLLSVASIDCYYYWIKKEHILSY